MKTRIVALVGMIGCTPSPPPEHERHEAKIKTNAPNTTRALDPFVGVILPREAVDVAAKTAGRLEKLHVKLGQHVESNDVIAELDVGMAQKEMVLAQAVLQSAEAEKIRAEIAANSARERHSRREVAKKDLSSDEMANIETEDKIAQATVLAANARVLEQQAKVSQIAQRIAYAQLRAPFAGTVAALYRSLGDMVEVGAQVVRIIGGSALWVRFAVPVDRITELSVGQRIAVRLGGVNQALEGHVEAIAPEIESASQMIFCEASLNLPDSLSARVLSGLVVNVNTK